jgi:molybdopterin converting factor small subunit
MAESSESLAQRVEALEQISHARVVERVGQIEQRVSRIESARQAEEPHVATKADIARLETLVVESRSDLQEQVGETRSHLQAQVGETRSHLQAQVGETRSDLQEQIGDLRSDLLRQMGENHSDLEEKINAVNTAGEKRLRHFLMWLIGTAIALAAVIIAAFAIIVAQLP